MRTVENVQFTIGQTAIEDIQLDARSRDDIPVILRGIQFIYCNAELRGKVFALLEKHLFKSPGDEGNHSGNELPKINASVGRPGMQLWQALVLSLLKQGLNCDYDRLHELANKHLDVRRMLGLGIAAKEDCFKYRTVHRNVQLLTPELLREINLLTVQYGHELAGHGADEPIQARCDSFIVETDVHYPTDVSLLQDSLRCLIRVTAEACAHYGVPEWRQDRHLQKRARRLFQRVRSAKQRGRKPERVAEYVAEAIRLAERAEGSLKDLERAGADPASRRCIESYLGYARKLANQVERRVIRGETIPQEEKVFSIFEPHTRWCCKGKAGRPVELGVPVSVVESERQFIMNHKVMWSGSDSDVAVELIAGTLENHGNMRGCSFDKGYHSAGNQERLGKVLELNAMPRKGRLSKKAREVEGAAEFKAARQAHSAIESAINNLECRGLDRVRDHGQIGFERMVGLAILAANTHRIGSILRDRERKGLRHTRLLRAA